MLTILTISFVVVLIGVSMYIVNDILIRHYTSLALAGTRESYPTVPEWVWVVGSSGILFIAVGAISIFITCYAMK